MFCTYNLHCKVSKKRKTLNFTILDFWIPLLKMRISWFWFCNPATKRVKIQLFWFLFSMREGFVVFASPIWSQAFTSDSKGLEPSFYLFVVYKVYDFYEMVSCSSIKVPCIWLGKVCWPWKHPLHENLSHEIEIC